MKLPSQQTVMSMYEYSYPQTRFVNDEHGFNLD